MEGHKTVGQGIVWRDTRQWDRVLCGGTQVSGIGCCVQYTAEEKSLMYIDLLHTVEPH